MVVSGESMNLPPPYRMSDGHDLCLHSLEIQCRLGISCGGTDRMPGLAKIWGIRYSFKCDVGIYHIPLLLQRPLKCKHDPPFRHESTL